MSKYQQKHKFFVHFGPHKVTLGRKNMKYAEPTTIIQNLNKKFKVLRFENEPEQGRIQDLNASSAFLQMGVKRQSRAEAQSQPL